MFPVVPNVNYEDWPPATHGWINSLANSLALHLAMFEPTKSLQGRGDSLTPARMANWLNDLQTNHKVGHTVLTGTHFYTVINALKKGDGGNPVRVLGRENPTPVSADDMRSSRSLIISDSGMSVYTKAGAKNVFQRDLKWFGHEYKKGYSKVGVAQNAAWGLKEWIPAVKEFIQLNGEYKGSDGKFPKNMPCFMFDNLNSTITKSGYPMIPGAECGEKDRLYGDLFKLLLDNFTVVIYVVTRRSDLWGYNLAQDVHRHDEAQRAREEAGAFLFDGEPFWSALRAFPKHSASGALDLAHHFDKR